LDEIRIRRPAAAVLDRVMPENEGTRTCTELKLDTERADNSEMGGVVEKIESMRLSGSTSLTEQDPLIVVADDNPDIRLLLGKRLARRGYKLVLTANGRDALDEIRIRRPAAAVLDRVMPEIDGAHVCAELKADPETANIPVVLLSARAAEKDVVAGFEHGADEYLTKPFDIEELDETLQRLMLPV